MAAKQDATSYTSSRLLMYLLVRPVEKGKGKFSPGPATFGARQR